jgi:hypothetical protein
MEPRIAPAQDMWGSGEGNLEVEDEGIEDERCSLTGLAADHQSQFNRRQRLTTREGLLNVSSSSFNSGKLFWLARVGT